MATVIARDNAELHVRIVGRGEPVLMLHGLGMESRHWLPWIAPFVHRYRFILPDARGAGRSAGVRFNQPADIFQNLTEDVEDIIAHLALKDYTLAGYSLGASTALHLQRYKGFDGVRRYLHIDQSPCIGNADAWPHGLFGREQEAFFAMLAELQQCLDRHYDAEHLADLPRGDYMSVVGLLADTLVSLTDFPWVGNTLRTAAKAQAVFCKVFPLTDLVVLRAYLASYLKGTHDYRDSLRDCITPITVFAGKQSPLYPLDGQAAIRHYAPRARLVGFERSGHLPMVDEPVKFIREFGRFLAGQ
jgi:pimeloyl-ACP methyl ester carboxylesterase